MKTVKKEADIIYLKRRKIKHWLIVLIFLVLVLIGLRLRIENVEVLGIRNYTAEQAEELVFGGSYWDRNTVVCLINKLRGKKKELPFVSDYEISIKGPASCQLVIYEKNPVGCIRYMSNYMYFDKDGNVIESTDERLDGVPVIKGVSYGHIVLGKKLPLGNEVIFSDILNIKQLIDDYNENAGESAKINCDSIKFDEYMNITLSIENGDINVELGDNTDISVKISAMYDMIPSLRERGLKGTLDLSSYSDSTKGEVTSFKIRGE